jgi:hypothetical protein
MGTKQSNSQSPLRNLAATGTELNLGSDLHNGISDPSFVKLFSEYFNIDPKHFSRLGLQSGSDQGLSAMQLIKYIYGNTRVSGLPWRLSYASRDAPGKNHWLNPAKFDAHTLPKNMNVVAFYSELTNKSREILGDINSRWNALGLPSKSMGIMGLPVPDTGTTMANPKLMKIFFDNYKELIELVADADSISRFTIQRWVRPFWYIRNMTATNIAVSSGDASLLDAYMTGIAKQMYGTKAGLQLLKETALSTGDPIGTNSGWPIMTATVAGKLDSKQYINSIMVQVAKQSPKNWSEGDIMDWGRRIAASAQVVTGFDARELPYATLLTRRFKPNYKPLPLFQDAYNGHLIGSVHGAPEQRVAFMFSYLHNLLTTPIMVHMKTTRKLVTGMYHDEEGKRKYASILRKSAANGQFLIENDAGGFDTNISYQSFQTASGIINRRLRLPYSEELNYSLMMGVRNNPIVLPDPNSTKDETGVLAINHLGTGLQSGSKLTGEWGSIITKWLNLIAYNALGWMSVDDIYKHGLTGNFNDGKGLRLQLIQGDDNTHIINNADEALALSAMLHKVYSSFGIKADIELSDRFLMRHVFDAEDRPVIGRIFQQRLSNEKAPEHSIVSSIGLASSTENMGSVTYDAMADARAKSGMQRNVKKQLLPHQRKAIEYILSVYNSAAFPAPYIKELTSIIKSGFDSSSATHSQSKKLSDLLRKMASELASMQLGHLDEDTGQYVQSSRSDFIRDLIADQHSPSSAAVLDMLRRSSPDIRNLVDSTELAGVNLLQSTLNKANIPLI